MVWWLKKGDLYQTPRFYVRHREGSVVQIPLLPCNKHRRVQSSGQG